MRKALNEAWKDTMLVAFPFSLVRILVCESAAIKKIAIARFESIEPKGNSSNATNNKNRNGKTDAFFSLSRNSQTINLSSSLFPFHAKSIPCLYKFCASRWDRFHSIIRAQLNSSLFLSIPISFLFHAIDKYISIASLRTWKRELCECISNFFAKSLSCDSFCLYTRYPLSAYLYTFDLQMRAVTSDNVHLCYTVTCPCRAISVAFFMQLSCNNKSGKCSPWLIACRCILHNYYVRTLCMLVWQQPAARDNRKSVNLPLFIAFMHSFHNELLSIFFCSSLLAAPELYFQLMAFFAVFRHHTIILFISDFSICNTRIHKLVIVTEWNMLN